MNRFLSLSALTVLLCGAAHAALPMAKPVSAWLVGPSEIKKVATLGIGKGCSMVAEYDNGQVVGLHAKQDGLIGMTVDVRTNVLAKGRGYIVTMRVDKNTYSLPARANDSTTVSIDLKGADPATLGTQLSRAGNFSLAFDGEAQAKSYATTGLNDGFARLQNCLNDELDEAPMLVAPVKLSIVGKQNSALPALTTPGAVSASPLPPISPIDEDKLYGSYDNLLPDVAPKGMAKSPAVKDLPKPSLSLPAAPKAAAKDDGVIRKDMPLTLALAGLVPSGTKYNITGADPMMTVHGFDTLEGKKPDDWRKALDGILADKGLRATDKGGKLYILPGAIADKTATPVQPEMPAKPASKLPPMPVAGLEDPSLDLPPPVGAVPATQAAKEFVFADTGTVVAAKPTWTARKGERVVDVLASWARQAGVPAQLDVDAKMRVPSNFSMQGDLQTAADALLKPFSKKNEIRTSLAVPAPVQPAPVTPPAPPVWRGASGTPLRDVLTAWGTQNNVDVVWDADQMFDLRDNVRISGSFETAVQGVMDQYDGDEIRPLAKLNTDPTTGKKTLIIQSNQNAL